MYLSERHRQRGEFYWNDACFTEDPRINRMSLDTDGVPLSSVDKDIMRNFFLNYCSSPEIKPEVLEQIRENDRIYIRNVPLLEQCEIRKLKDFKDIRGNNHIAYKVGAAFSGIGIVGSVLLLSAFLGKEFRQNHILSPLLALQVAFNISLLGICLQRNIEHIIEFDVVNRGTIPPSCLVSLYFFTMASSGSVQVMIFFIYT